MKAAFRKRMDSALAQLLVFVVLPAWVLAEWMDWICHRITGLAYGSGVRESLFHLALAALMAIAVLLAALFVLNALVLTLLGALWLLYQATLIADARYAAPRRMSSALEQHVHWLLSGLSSLALALCIALHRDAGGGGFLPVPRPLPQLGYPLAALGAGLLILPFAEELWRSLRASRIPNPTSARSDP